jgi:cytochrome c-type biogenesis protein CcsB
VRAAPSRVNISQNLQLLGRSGIILSNVLLIVLLCNRWKESGHFPLSNLYESLMFLSWSFTVLHLFIENLTNYHTTSNQNIGKFIGAITTPSALFTNAFATFTLPKEMQGSSSLVPALQSNWLMMHVTVMIISYAALIIGSLLSIAYLIITIQFHSNSDTNNNKNMGLPNSSTSALTLDNLSYRILGIGFPFLTIGILSGAVWANEAWGSYWSWDPKETWAFLTWLVYAIYLHTRLNKGWEGKKPAIIASFGFIVTWICYLGVNLIGEGLHSYGWILK